MKFRYLITTLIAAGIILLFTGSGSAHPGQGPSSITNKYFSGETITPSSIEQVDGPTDWVAYIIDDSSADVGEYPSIVLDGGGYTHISYTDAANSQLKYIYEGQDGYWYPTIFDSSEGEGKYSSLALDKYGLAHISYHDGDSLRYVHEDLTWTFGPSELVTGGVNDNYGSLAILNDDSPYFSYNSGYGLRISFQGSNYPPYYSHYTVDSRSPQVGIESSMKVDQNGYLHISYYDNLNANLMYVYQDHSGWRSPLILDWEGYVGARTSLALDKYGNPHISYWDWGNGYLKYVYRDIFGNWYREIVDNSGTAGEYSSIALDKNGLPHISYYDHQSPGDGNLMYAYKTTDGGWQKILLYSEGDVGIDPSIALDGHDNAHIAFYDGTNHRLLYFFQEYTPSGLIGNTDCPWGSSNCNPCVSNVIQSFNNLDVEGDIMGFHLGDHPDPGWAGLLELEQHWQGLQRIMAGDGRYMVVSHDDTDGWSSLAVVHLGTRNGEEGERFRSNRLLKYYDFSSTYPNSSDIVVETGYLYEGDYKHPGGIQAMGDILAVGTGDKVSFVHLADPNNLTKSPYILELDEGKTGSTTALAQLHDGTYLLVLSSSDASSLDFFRSYNTNIDNGFYHIAEWLPEDLIMGYNDLYGWDAFQSLNLVTECSTGRLYLIGTGSVDATSTCVPDWFPKWGGKCYPDGSDEANLYEVRFEDTWEEVQITKVGRQKFKCSDKDGKDQCNFDAGAGIYVDPNNQLFLYSTEHASNGPNNTVKFMEFRPRPHASCKNIQNAWVELFEGTTADQPGRRSLMIDWQDSHLEDYSNYDNVEDFGEVANSAEYCLPEDWSYVLYGKDYSSGGNEDPCGGRQLRLSGSGTVRTSNFREQGFGNTAYCSEFCYDPPVEDYYDPDIGVTIRYYPPSYCSAESAVISENTNAEDRSVSVDIPPNAFNEPLNFSLDSVSPPSYDTMPLSFAGTGFRTSYTGTDTAEEDFTFVNPVLISIQYAEDDISGIDEASLGLYFWDAPTLQWVDATTTCIPQAGSWLDTQNNTLQASVCMVGEFALLGNLYPTRVLVDEAHDNLLTLSWTRAQEIANSRPYSAEPEWFSIIDLNSYLSDEYQMEAFTGPTLTTNLLANYSVLIIPNYEGSLTHDEVLAVQSFVQSGGGLILVGDCAFHNNNPEMAATYGGKYYSQCLFGPVPELEGAFTVNTYEEHPASIGVEEFTFNWGQALALTGTAERIASTNDDIWLDINGNDTYDEEDPVGSFVAGSAYDTGCGKVLMINDNTFADADLSWTENEGYMRSLLDWVSTGRNCTREEKWQPAKVLLDEAHDNQSTLDWERAEELAAQWGDPFTPEDAYLGYLREILSAEFLLESHSGSPLTREILDNYDALIVPIYNTPFTPAEVAAVKDYVTQGGGLILLGGCGFEPPYPNLASNYGIHYNPACLFSPSTEVNPDFQITNFAEHPAIKGEMDLIISWGQTLEISGDAAWLANTGNTDSWIDINQNWEFDEGEGGVFDVAAAYDNGCGRVVGYADESFMDSIIERTDNDAYMRSMLRWVVGGYTCNINHNLYLPMITN